MPYLQAPHLSDKRLAATGAVLQGIVNFNKKG
jgi:hypothetical protein